MLPPRLFLKRIMTRSSPSSSSLSPLGGMGVLIGKMPVPGPPGKMPCKLFSCRSIFATLLLMLLTPNHFSGAGHCSSIRPGPPCFGDPRTDPAMSEQNRSRVAQVISDAFSSAS